MIANRLLALDTASLYFRAFYALPSTLRAPDGRPANAVRGLADFIASFVAKTEATHVACAWDVDWRPAWRVAAVPSYKTHRVANLAELGAPVVVDPRADGIRVVQPADEATEETPDDLAVQIPMILQMLTAAGLAPIGAVAAEADDVLGTLARTAPMPVEILTGDRDLLQLVDDARDVRVWYTATSLAKTVPMDEAAVVAAHGVLPQRYADYATLRGDPSDGLPGVSGVGPKTAVALLTAYGDLAGVVRAARDDSSDLKPGVRAKILAAQEQVMQARTVVGTVDDLPLHVAFEDLVVRPLDVDAWAATSEHLGLGGAGQRLADALLAAAQRAHR